MTQIAAEPNWNPRVEFAMRGEPTMHPDYVGMIRLARECAPRLQLMMTSNAGGLLRRPGPAENVLALFEAGLNVLALDDYDGVKFVTKVRESIYAMVEGPNPERWQKLGAHYYEYPADPRGNPHTRRKPHERALVFIEDISRASKGTHSMISNHAGVGAPPNDDQYGARCAKPFRELGVRWDGRASVCCNDWRGVFKAGSVVDDGLDAVWNGEALEAARRKLYLGERDFGPCKGCDARSYRVGLLPDKFGKEKMPRPSKTSDAAIARALAGKPMTAPVLRPWEKKP